MTFDFVSVELFAQIATIGALIFSVASFLRERKNRQELERRAQILVWADLAKLRGLMTDLEKPIDSNGADYGKHQAVGKLTSMYRDKVRQVYELSPTVRPSDVRLWRKSGKIASDWQEWCFWEVFPQKNLPDELPSDFLAFSSSDELPDDHAMAAKPKLNA